MPVTEAAFGKGAVKDIFDARDFTLLEVAGAPLPFDWDTGFDVEDSLKLRLGNPLFKIPVKDQGGSFSCGGQAWSYYSAVQEALATGTFEECSAKYVYAQTHAPGGGSRGRDNSEIFTKQGVARESVLASKPATEAFLTRSEDIGDTARIDARKAKSALYAQPALDINTVASAIRDYGGVILGVDGQDNGTWLSEFPKYPNQTTWRHWLYCFAAKRLNGQQKHIGVINSWGEVAGIKGRQWLYEDYFTSGHIFSAWSHVFAPVVIPPPTQHIFNVNMEYGQSSQEVNHLQNKLKRLGFFPSQHPTTQFYGDVTRRSVLNFQLAFKVSSVEELLLLQGRKFGPKSRTVMNSLN